MSLHLIGEPERPLFPATLEDRLRGLAGRLTGLAILAVAAAGWASLVTWSIADPSLTHATGGTVRNLVGPWGAIVADLLLQLLGLSSVAALVAPMFWAIELLAVCRLSEARVKLVFYPLSALILAGALAGLPVPASWPLHHGLGGILGDFIYNVVTSAFAALNPARAGAAAGLALFATGLAAVACSIGLKLRDVAALLGARVARSGWRVPSLTAPLSTYRAAEGAWPSLSLPAQRRAAPELKLEIPRDALPKSAWPAETARRAAPARRREPVLRGPSAVDPDSDPERDVEPEGEDASDLDPLTDEASRAIAQRFAPRTTAVQPLPLSPVAPSPPPAAPPQTMPEAPRAAPPPERARPAPALVAGKRAEPAYRPPALNMLKRPSPAKAGPEFTQAALRGNARLLEDVLADFGVKGEVRDIKPGPVVTLFELEPARGIKSARVISLADDIARSMSATSVRVAVVPGRNVIGIELPNVRRESVLLREMLESEAFRSSDAALPLALGKSIGGEPIVADLARMPHLLVAGTTGSGKSVGVNAMVLSLLYRHGPEECRLLMIDPKMLELSVYNGIPHLIAPVVTEPHKAVAALNWAVREMEERYKRMAQLAVRNIDVFNARVRNARQRGETIARTVQTGFDRETGQAVYEQEELDLEPMPYIVVVVDEFADLMLVAGKEIEAAVQRLAQMARAAGIHLVMATQRPSVDVITGTIKANFPTRISFKVTSKIDSRTIVNEQGAEQLLGSGDMLYSTGSGQLVRVHGPFVSDEEVESIAEALRGQGEPRYIEGVTDAPVASGPGVEEPRGQSDDDLYDRAAAVVLRDRKASTSYIQRRLGIGYNRAADLIERMEREGLVSPANAVGKREILAGSGVAGVDAA